MNSEAIWELSRIDLTEIQNIHDKIIALKNLKKIMPQDDSSDSYKKLVHDIEAEQSKFNNWWKEKSLRYGWKGRHWRIDFLTSKVYELTD